MTDFDKQDHWKKLTFIRVTDFQNRDKNLYLQCKHVSQMMTNSKLWTNVYFYTGNRRPGSSWGFSFEFCARPPHSGNKNTSAHLPLRFRAASALCLTRNPCVVYWFLSTVSCFCGVASLANPSPYDKSIKQVKQNCLKAWDRHRSGFPMSNQWFRKSIKLW